MSHTKVDTVSTTQCDNIIKSLSIVIPNYNGVELLKKNLPLLFDAIKYSNVNAEVLIVDDASTDSSVSFIIKEYNSIILLVNDTNRGFAETINRGVFAASKEIVMALNNDVAVEKEIFRKILPRFTDPDVFAISPNVFDPRDGRNQAVYKLKPGICWFTDVCVQAMQMPEGKEIPLFFASGGSSFYDKEKLWRLGGFDPIFKPFYVEDLDLSYRAWKAGWKCLLEPSARVFHEANSTIRKYYKRRRIKFLAAKNKVMFLWLNITDAKLVCLYVLFFVPSLIWDVLTFRKYKFIGTFMALAKLPEIIVSRRKRKALFRVKDAEIIKMVSL